MARIIIISGACGTGKTTISKILAEKSEHNLAVHIHTDDYYQYIKKGYIHPWMNGTGKQNNAVISAAAASAEKFALNGYEVFVDGTIGPWFLEPWLNIAESGVDVRYIILRPDAPTTVRRAMQRTQREEFPLHSEAVQNIWQSFQKMDKYEENVIDTTNQTVDETVAFVKKHLQNGGFSLMYFPTSSQFHS